MAMNLRVMWLLNHSSARKFEVPMLKKIGINQIFTPKKYPDEVGFRSASVDFSEDESLDIPVADLKILNAAEWHLGADAEAWRIANKYFDVVFFMFHRPELLENAARYFGGAVILRAYGVEKESSYGRVARIFNNTRHIKKIGKRFYFGEAYSHLADSDSDYLKARRIFLPLGLSDASLRDVWQGGEPQIYFVCPDICTNIYYQNIYDEFCRNFTGFKYVIAGAQAIKVDDPQVLGYVTNEQHAYNMAQSRVMFYHSSEPNHIHYHPFEAIRAGMPLVFMAGGMLDRMGGADLPGRCKTVSEARHKIQRILGDDRRLIDRIRSSQAVLLESMKPENCEQAWRDGFARIDSELAAWRTGQAVRSQWQKKRKRVAVVLPVEYRGGSLRGALELVKALYIGSRQAEDAADIVFMHLDDSALYQDEDFSGLPEGVMRRPFKWRILSQPEARRAMYYAGFVDWIPVADNYIIPDDGVQQLADCDACLIVSDRLAYPVLPIKPIALMVYDYVQRYIPHFIGNEEQSFLAAARSANKVFVTTEFTHQDALQYAGVEPGRLRKVPMLIPEFSVFRDSLDVKKSCGHYFLWTTNAAPHKNHKNAVQALEIYYEELDGRWDCKITGANTKGILDSRLPHLQALAEIFKRCAVLRRRVKWLGELPDCQYKKVLAEAEFLWHAGRIDNGTFSVVEAAFAGVPALSSDYPAMREMNAEFGLNMLWMDPASPRDMARKLKDMEQEANMRRAMLPGEAELRMHGVDHYAKAYWQELHEII
ncbi:glycosyltransferase [Paenacidovorax caeni]|nr:glycosyltransferase [Paenacidovorax caeni]